MSEGWCDWPILGDGWKRRTVVRKSGASCGHSDTYYLSPSGERFRSKNELSKFFGDSVDLSLFHFKDGVLLPEERQRKTPRKHVLSPKSPGEPQSKKQRLSCPAPIRIQPYEVDDASEVVCCSGCNGYFTGVELGKTKHAVWYCADCRASRRAFNKQQKQLKNTGCGSCSACKLPENCGYCTVCLLRFHNPEFGSSWKCVKRRCLQVLRKGSDCGDCQGCCMTEDCEACDVCLSREQVTGDGAREKCLKRRCINKKPEKPSHKLKGVKIKKPSIKWKPLSLKSKHKKKNYNKVKPTTEKRVKQLAGRRRNRICGQCEACLRKLECGECDFCLDKPKYGGRNLKRQKCRFRQCLRFAVEKNIPLSFKSTTNPVLLERIRSEAADDVVELVSVTKQEEEVQVPFRVPVIRLERLDQRNGDYTDSESWAINTVNGKETDEEYMESSFVEEQEEPLDLHCSVRTKEFITEDDDVEEADESTPVIMEIFSLGSYTAANGLHQVLQEFMAELHEIPLPAHWEVQSQRGPDLQLVQRSKVSTMAETTIHIQPGLHFYIVVRDYTVPSMHELYDHHPSRLTTVDDVVELICDLEAYRPCAGLPKQGPRSPNCWVLVREKKCPECCMNPWPSGSAL